MTQRGNCLLKHIIERQKGREGDKEDVSSYWMTQRWNCLPKHLNEIKTEGRRRQERTRKQLLDAPERKLSSKTPHWQKYRMYEKVRKKTWAAAVWLIERKLSSKAPHWQKDRMYEKVRKKTWAAAGWPIERKLSSKTPHWKKDIRDEKVRKKTWAASEWSREATVF